MSSMSKPSEFEGKILVFTAPSGAGKTTIVRHLLKTFDNVAFSVSATTRPMRDGEIDGLHYHFISLEAFHAAIENDEFIEYEEVYSGSFYGTLKSELERQWKAGKHVLFDIDVKGALSIKSEFGAKALTVFVEPPSVDVLEERLRMRGTESSASLEKRLAKVRKELNFSAKFDKTLLNDHLPTALEEAEQMVRDFLTP